MYLQYVDTSIGRLSINDRVLMRSDLIHKVTKIESASMDYVILWFDNGDRWEYSVLSAIDYIWWNGGCRQYDIMSINPYEVLHEKEILLLC